MANKSSLKIFFELLLRPLDIPQSRVVPPQVFDAIYNCSTAWLIGKIAELWPKDQSYVDIIEPFLRADILPVKNGYVDLPTEYRNFLDVGALVQSDTTGACKECDEPEYESQAVALRKYNKVIQEGTCVRQAIVEIDQSQWDYITKSEFDKPTFEKPVCAFFGKQKLRVCPADIKTVEFRYLINEQVYRYGYIMLPDDTFIFDPLTSIESEFKNNAFDKLYRPAMALLGVYLHDQNIQNFGQILSDVEFK